MASNSKYGFKPVSKSEQKHVVKPIASCFNEDSDEDDKEESASARFRQKYGGGLKEKDKRQIERNLAEDPTIYEYDLHYDEIEKQKNQKVIEQRKADEKKEPKYANKIMEAHKKRENLNLIRDDNVYKKERVAEGGKFDDKEMYITGAYRKQIEEREQFRKEVEIKDRIDDLTNVKGQQMWQMTFQHKMLEDRVRTYADANANSDKKEEHTTIKEEGIKSEKSSLRPTEIKDEPNEDEKDSSFEEHRPSSRQERKPSAAGSQQRASDKKDEGQSERKMVVEEKDRKEASRREKRRHSSRSPSAGGHPSTSSKKTKEEESKNSGSRKFVKSSKEEEREEMKAKMNKIREILKRRNDEEAIAEMRKRYFQRLSEGLVVPPSIVQAQ